jgi:Sec-independent protein translocase protein TatA
MLTEKVKEIKSAEEQAEAIIKKAGEESLVIASSLGSAIKEFREEKEKNLKAMEEEYRKRMDEETEESINALEKDYDGRTAFLRAESSGKISAASELLWQDIKKSMFTP